MIWSDKTKEAVAGAIFNSLDRDFGIVITHSEIIAQAALAAVAESDEIKALQEEIEEQCRINGLGSERELALMAKVEALYAEIACLKSQIEFLDEEIKRLKATHEEEMENIWRLIESEREERRAQSPMS